MFLQYSSVACVIVGSFVANTFARSPEIPGAPQKQPIAIVGATIHPVSGPVIEQGTILFDKGKIVALGDSVPLPPNTQRINAAGKHVYPSMFDAHTDLGLTEIGSIKATQDARELGTINPNVKARVAINPDSELIPVARANGVLLAGSCPSGGLISGQSSVIQLDGWTWEHLTLKGDVAMNINWPRMSPVSDWWSASSSPSRRGGSSTSDSLDILEQMVKDVRAYQKARKHSSQQAVDLKLESMIPVIEGKQLLIVQADETDQIQAAVAFANRHGMQLVIRGGYDALACRRLLKEHEIPVIVSAVYRLPRRRDENFDAAYTLPERLRQAGIRFCITSAGRGANVRNLPYHAATAVAYGLPEDEAIRAITLYPAQILGVDKRVGSLEKGKDATLFVCDGNPLETPTQVEHAYIQGRKIQLSSRHTRLYDKYRERGRRSSED